MYLAFHGNTIASNGHSLNVRPGPVTGGQAGDRAPDGAVPASPPIRVKLPSTLFYAWACPTVCVVVPALVAGFSSRPKLLVCPLPTPTDLFEGNASIHESPLCAWRYFLSIAHSDDD